MTARLAKRGTKIWMEGDSIVTPGAKLTHYDTLDKLGFLLEAVTKSQATRSGVPSQGGNVAISDGGICV